MRRRVLRSLLSSAVLVPIVAGGCISLKAGGVVPSAVSGSPDANTVDPDSGPDAVGIYDSARPNGTGDRDAAGPDAGRVDADVPTDARSCAQSGGPSEDSAWFVGCSPIPQADSASGARHSASDYDGDGIADLSVWRPSDPRAGGHGGWYVSPSASDDGRPGSSPVLTAFGESGDIPVPADYDGDGKTDLSVWRANDPSVGGHGGWYIAYSGGAAPPALPGAATMPGAFGESGDIPVPADYDGDGQADIAVYRPSTGEWFITFARGGSSNTFPGVTSGDIAAPADYDGDGKADVAYWRPNDSQAGGQGGWHIALSGGRSAGVIAFGQAGDTPVPGDYDGDGKADLAVWRPGAGWLISYSGNGVSPDASGTATPIAFGEAGDLPVPADYDGDGIVDLAVWRAPDPNTIPANAGGWYFLYSGPRTFGGQPIALGNSGDIPPVADVR